MEALTFEQETNLAIHENTDAIEKLTKRINELEYLVYRLAVKHPDIMEKTCAGCKYLETVRCYGIGHNGEYARACRNPAASFEDNMLKGCYRWRLNKETERTLFKGGEKERRKSARKEGQKR